MTQPRYVDPVNAILRRGPFDGDDAPAYEAFLREVFSFVPPRSERADPRWEPWAYFNGSGCCIAALEAATLDVVLDGTDVAFAALRLVGVAETHRGRGLFRDLATRALAWCDAHGPTLLYTETHALYAPFDFVPLAQHAFVGLPPAPAAGVRAAEAIDAARARALIGRIGPRCTPVSWHCAIRGATDLLRATLDEGDLALGYAEDLDALLVHERDDDEVTLVDVIAADMPSMPEIVAALQIDGGRLRVMFAPDRLAWEGMPERDETGLMIRGALPAAMRRPFMLPPTTSF